MKLSVLLMMAASLQQGSIAMGNHRRRIITQQKVATREFPSAADFFAISPATGENGGDAKADRTTNSALQVGVSPTFGPGSAMNRPREPAKATRNRETARGNNVDKHEISEMNPLQLFDRVE